MNFSAEGACLPAGRDSPSEENFEPAYPAYRQAGGRQVLILNKF